MTISTGRRKAGRVWREGGGGVKQKEICVQSFVLRYEFTGGLGKLEFICFGGLGGITDLRITPQRSK